ncbi:MAG: potassium channel family protein [archaeon]
MSYSRLFISVALIILILGIGTIQFHYAEDWSWEDSFYFTGMTMTTVGYGDFVPTTAPTKIFTVFYSILTIGVFLYSLGVVGEEIFKKRAENILTMFNKKQKRNPQTTLQKHLN